MIFRSGRIRWSRTFDEGENAARKAPEGSAYLRDGFGYIVSMLRQFAATSAHDWLRRVRRAHWIIPIVLLVDTGLTAAVIAVIIP